MCTDVHHIHRASGLWERLWLASFLSAELLFIIFLFACYMECGPQSQPPGVNHDWLFTNRGNPIPLTNQELV